MPDLIVDFLDLAVLGLVVGLGLLLILCGYIVVLHGESNIYRPGIAMNNMNNINHNTHKSTNQP